MTKLGEGIDKGLRDSIGFYEKYVYSGEGLFINRNGW